MAATKRGKKRQAEGTLRPKTVEIPETPKEPAPDCPIVGIGASAGGLAAFEAFFSGMPADADPGMAFVLVQHLAPDHESILADLIRRYTRMQVFEVEDGMAVQPNCAYIIPPNHDMAFLGGRLQLSEPGMPHGQRLPIDFFFRSLAQDRREQAICIVLSGTGSDGTQGVRAVKGEGGMAMAQTPESTEYKGMPQSAIATGLVDYELPPAEMPAQLIAYAARAFADPSHPASLPAPRSESALRKILVLLRTHTGHDFSQYKPNTVERRIARRMAVQQIENIDGYAKYVQQTPSELDALFRDLLIGVTHFFRDPQAFKALEEQIIPQILTGKPAGATIRVWVPGCSTGEEAYSIAILLQERLDMVKQNHKVSVFASDIDGRAIAAARAGLYPANIASDVLPERLARFFAAEPDGTERLPSVYRVRKSIRDMLVFSEQDLVKDPPFSKLDLISCRNLLIYIDGDLQKKLVHLFHYALNPEGFLFLGTSENVGELAHLFTVVDRKSRLFQRKGSSLGAQRPAMAGLRTRGILAHESVQTPGEKKLVAGTLSLRDLTERTLLQQVAPAGALVNGHGDILYLHGRTGMYLEPAPGEAALNIVKMAREGLRPALAAALHQAAAADRTVRHAGLRVKTNGDSTTVHLTVRPVAPDMIPTPEALFLVLLEEAPPADAKHTDDSAALDAGTKKGSPGATEEARIAALKQELQSREEYLQTAIEELETANEELRSSNEEMLSVNEELQSTNEELETSKEELQSVNEELATVNAELQNRMADLARANNDMNNLLAGTGIATVFVDLQLRILRFTPTATEIINLILADIGRPVGHIVSNLLEYDRLLEDVQTVLDTLIPKDIEVRTKAGAWYQMHIQPYRTLDNVIEGAVLSFVNVTETKHIREVLQKTLDEVRTLRGILRICANCKRIRDEKGNWNQVEVYVGERTDAEFTHGLCPDCAKTLYPEYSLAEESDEPQPGRKTRKGK